ncbi:hypothetical protein FIV42_22120 [Persicimonas caeni]|uniref:Uncharacterized protein n=1 Tax=Persicimonas caeni TaxID=2292766 RepID=A0A4Y6PYL4_PERCE|nr:hypothetical protein [Persicimonas caeni]QDG53343.1 hypothetical protein FIV42_22120 [Persicimonas caeni]QED34564.1 hypothetical protein FRD00_22115 [Persicimonas caeni]
MTQELEFRPGLTSSEAAIAWAYARFGGEVDACDVLDGDAAKPVREVVKRVLEAPVDERARIVETWRRQDRRWDSLDELAKRLDDADIDDWAAGLGPRWKNALMRQLGRVRGKPCPWHDNSVRTRRAIVWLTLGPLRDAVKGGRAELIARSGFDLEHLVQMARGEREAWIRQLGVFQLVELTREQDRRSLARLRRALREEDRAWFDACSRYERDIDRIERGHLREFFLAISRQEPDLTARLLHLGLYTIAASSGERFAPKLRSVASRLPSTFETLLLHYHRGQQRTAAPTLAPTMRGSITLFVERRAEYGGIND